MKLIIINFLTNAKFSDFAVAVIVILLGILAYFLERLVSQMQTFQEKNSEEHNKINERIVSFETWSSQEHDNLISPAYQKANKNENDIIELKAKVKFHGVEIKDLSERVKKMEYGNKNAK